MRNRITLMVIVLQPFAGVLGCVAAHAEAVETVDTSAITQCNTAFALDLYAKLGGEQGNLFFSPFSLSSALAMTYAGAKGDTAQQMAEVLHFPDGQGQLHPAFRALTKGLIAGTSEGYRLHIANALWAQEDYSFLETFIDLTKTYYDAGLSKVDFKNATEDARKTINAWVEKETQEKIKDLIKPGGLNSMIRLVLTNAIYFKGKWAEPFEEAVTRDEPFHVTHDKTVTVPTMSLTKRFNYLETDQFQALELPYEGRALSMCIFLPRKVDGLAAFEQSLTAENLTGWLGGLQGREVQVMLPRFTTTKEFSLSKVLSEMGMPLAFGPKADFSGMTLEEELYIAAVLHKAFIEVNEEGTEAAAATAVIMAATAVPQPAPVFRADHPFIFLIRDTRSGSILFMGRVVNPQEA